MGERRYPDPRRHVRTPKKKGCWPVSLMLLALVIACLVAVL